MSSFRHRLFALLAGFMIAVVANAEPVVLKAADGAKVYAEAWRVAAPKAPVILAFHQAQSNKAEYAPLAKRINAAGFTLLAIDQRSGGNYFGGINQTVAGLGAATSYEAAMADLEAALVWGEDAAHGAPVIVWGSSYSAALVFLLAAQNPGGVDGVLAFSPDEYLAQRRAVRDAAEKVRVPVFITQAIGRGEVDRAHRIYRAVDSEDKIQFVPTKGGTHGSSTLREDTNPGGAEENWAAVLKFLAQFRKP
jgi:dienelactone hydrolase